MEVVVRVAFAFFLFMIAIRAHAVSFYSESNTIMVVGELKGELIWGMFDPDSEDSYYNGESDGGEVSILFDDIKLKVPQQKGKEESDFWTETIGFVVIGRDVLNQYDLKFNLQTSDVKFLPKNDSDSREFISGSMQYIAQPKDSKSGSKNYYSLPSIAYCGVRKGSVENPLAKRVWANGSLKVVSSLSGFTPTVMIEDSRTEDNVFGITEIGCEQVLVRIGEESSLNVWGQGEVKTTASFLSHVLGTPIYELKSFLFINNAVLEIADFEEAEDVAVLKIGEQKIEDAWDRYVSSSNDERISMISKLFDARSLLVQYDQTQYEAKFDENVMENELYTSKESGMIQSKVRSIRRSGRNHESPITTYIPKLTRGAKKLVTIPTT